MRIDTYYQLSAIIGDVYKIAIINYRQCILLLRTQLSMASVPIADNTYSPIMAAYATSMTHI